MTYKIFPKNIFGASTDVSLGSVNIIENEKAWQRIVKFLNKQGFKFKRQNIVFTEQTHSDNIKICTKTDGGKIIRNNDGLITAEKDLVLVIKTADCVPVLMADPKQNVIAAIHAGRVGLLKQIVSKAGKIFIHEFHSNPTNTLVALGPHIRKDNYPLHQKAVENLTDFGLQFTSEQNGQIYFDETACCLSQLHEIGIPAKNIEDCGIDTYQDFKQYYSARRREENPKLYPEGADFGTLIFQK